MRSHLSPAGTGEGDCKLRASSAATPVPRRIPTATPADLRSGGLLRALLAFRDSDKLGPAEFEVGHADLPGDRLRLNSVFVILNPASCGGRTHRVERRLGEEMERRKISFRLLRTEEAGHAEELAREAASSADRLLVVGGDGTLHEVANGLLTSGSGRELPPIAILPMGTGNDFHRMVGTGSGVDQALELVERGRPTSFDLGLARWGGEERYFVNLLGVGIDVEVLRIRKSLGRLPGLLQYLTALGVALVRFDPLPFQVELEPDGGETRELLTGRILISAVTVGPSIGGGFMLCPDATPDDGFLDLCHLGSMGPMAIARNLPRVLRGTHGEAKQIRLRRLRQARFSTPNGEPFAFEMDGELVSVDARTIDISVQPKQLPVLVPSGDRKA